ncbi:MAG: hypothetical protein Q4G03_01070 [Planctomycetia bacterium]|nr:hypothetical protein [Planctomycetia bacterium]
MTNETQQDNLNYTVERIDESKIIVSIHSEPYREHTLPDARFTFRRGDPQYELWASRCTKSPQTETETE